MKKLIAALAFVAMAPVMIVAPAHAQAVAPLRPFDPAIVRVAGRAELYLPPDQARIRVSFYSPARTALEATQNVSTRARALETAARAIHATNVTLERTDVSVQPVMREGGERRPDRINGYEATASVTLLVRDLALLSRAMEAAIGAEPDRFDEVSFSIADTAAARRAAREVAIADAVDKARVYVEGAGHRLGRLLLVEEGAGGMIIQTGNRAMEYAVPAPPPPPGEPLVPPPVAPTPQLYT
ncbi:MAG: SIMPL domain-containing protein, partial [Hyphomonadaceae bacterium]